MPSSSEGGYFWARESLFASVWESEGNRGKSFRKGDMDWAPEHRKSECGESCRAGMRTWVGKEERVSKQGLVALAWRPRGAGGLRSAPGPKRKQECGVGEDEGAPERTVGRELADPRVEGEQKGDP